MRLSTSKGLVVGLVGWAIAGIGGLFTASAHAGHLHGHVVGLDRPAVAICAGGRASCGDRVGRLVPDLARFDLAELSADHCTGGRRMCGDRIADTSAAIERPSAGDGWSAPHPRLASR